MGPDAKADDRRLDSWHQLTGSDEAGHPCGWAADRAAPTAMSGLHPNDRIEQRPPGRGDGPGRARRFVPTLANPAFRAYPSAVLRAAWLGLLAWCAALGLGLAPHELRAQSNLVISEFLAINDSGLRDENGDYSDWIELHNPSPLTVNLSGWSLTDEADQLTKWQFPATNLAARGFLVVYASGKNRRTPGAPLHTNFKLDGDGEYLALVQPDGQTVASEFAPRYPEQYPDIPYGFGGLRPILPTNAPVKYWVPSNGTLGLSWVAPAFEDGAWASGTNGLGYETAGTSYGPYVRTDLRTAMFGNRLAVLVRIPFGLTNAAALKNLTLRIRYDDGFVAYLNGTEIARRNTPTSPAWDTPASSTHRGDTAEAIDLSASANSFQEGANLLAILALNDTAASPTFLVQAEIVEFCPELAPAGFLSPSSPGQPNLGGTAPVLPAVEFVPPDGVYTNNSLSVELSSPIPGAVVRYTVDGSKPTATSAAYTSPIGLSKSTILRTLASAPGYIPCPMQSACYSLLEPNMAAFSSPLPLVYLDTFNQVINADMTARANCALAVLEPDPATGRTRAASPPAFHGRAGVEGRGQTSWTRFAKKPYNVETRAEDDTAKDVPLLDLPAGSDWALISLYDDKSLLNDYIAHSLFSQMGHYDVRCRYVEVFWNGLRPEGTADNSGKVGTNDYVGIYLLMEKIRIAKHRVNLAQLGPSDTNASAITGGYIWAKDKNSPGDVNFTTSRGQALKFYDPRGADLLPVQRQWLNNHLNAFETALYGANWRDPVLGYAQYIDCDSFVDNHWIVEYSKQVDGFRFSSYFQKDRNGKIKWEPLWDWNLSFGNANYLEGGYTDGWYWPLLPVEDHIWARRLVGAPGDPDYLQRITDRWGELRGTVFQPTNVFAQVDSITNLLNEPKDRDYVRFPRLGIYLWPNPDGAYGGNPPRGPWHVDYQNPPTYAAIVGQWKSFVTRRYNWIDGTFLRAPAFSRTGGLPGTPLAISNYHSGLAGALVYYTLDGSDPRLAGGSVSPVARVCTGSILPPVNAQIVARVAYTNAWSPPARASFGSPVPSLAITEIMFHPAASSPTNSGAEDLEFIEFRNNGTNALDLNGWVVSGGISVRFAAATLLPGQLGVLVHNLAAFQARYGTNSRVLGTFVGDLGNGGDQIVLTGARGEPILDFTYRDEWCPLADGNGFSLVFKDPNLPATAWDVATNWRASTALGGSPGQVDPPPPLLPAVLVNEVLAHSQTGRPDALELYNPTDGPADIGSWYLSDDFQVPRKYRIPVGTWLAAGGYLVFDATNSFGATNLPSPFGLASDGDDVYLFSANAAGELTGYYHGFSFGGSDPDVSFGRYLSSDAEEHLVAQAALTFGLSNAGPRVGPVVIAEIMYHPPDDPDGSDNSADEFIELINLTETNVCLYDPQHPTNAWRLRAGVEYAFPPGAMIPAHGYLMVVNFDPNGDLPQRQLFAARYGLPSGALLVGPYGGKLNNQEDNLELARPGTPDLLTGLPPYVLVDKVHYRDDGLWPMAADGSGRSLRRLVLTGYGNDPANWTAAPPTPGTAPVPGELPVIHLPPLSQTNFVHANIQFSVAVEGPPPLAYQWRFDGQGIPGETNSTLVLTDVQPARMGQYQVWVANPFGSVNSRPAGLVLYQAASILSQPQSQVVLLSNTATLTVSALGNGPLSYQWQFNGTNLPGATNATLALTNVQLNQAGSYLVLLTDAVGTVASQPATLSVAIRPSVTGQPQPEFQTLVEGQTLTLTAAIATTEPYACRWLQNGATAYPYGVFGPVLQLSNVVLTNGGTYKLALTNASGSIAQSSNAYVTVVSPPVNLSVPLGGQITFTGCVNGPLTLTLSNAASGLVTNRLRYQWLFGQQPLLSGTNLLTKGNTNLLSLTNVRMNQAGVYTYAVTDVGGFTSSFPALLTVIPPFAPPWIAPAVLTNGQVFLLSVSTLTNVHYTLQRSETLSPASWLDVTNTLGTGLIWSVAEPVSGPSRFYRLQASP